MKTIRKASMMLSAVALFAIAPSLLAQQSTPVVTREWFSENVAGLQALPSSAQWTIDKDCFISNNVGIVVDESVEYAPSRTSATNLPATVVTRLNFTVGDELPEIAAGSQLCLTACDTGTGPAYYVALQDTSAVSNEWRKATGATPVGADTTVTVTNTFDYEAGTVSITVDGMPLSINSTSALPFNPMTNYISRLGVAGSGILGNISGTDSAAAAAAVNGVNYETFDAAVAAGTATSANPITLYAAATQEFSAGQTLYVNTNGFVFTTSAPTGYRVDYDGTVTYECVADTVHYTVKHFQQALDGSYPVTPAETDDLTGTTGTQTAAAAKSYTGFTAGSVTQTTIAGDGSTVVSIQYSRKQHTLSWITDGDTLTGDYTSGTVYYGAAITAPNTPTKTGYTFANWGSDVAATMPDANVTYTATWNVNQYTITFVDENGTTVLQPATQYDYGTVVANIVTPSTPVKAATAQYTYTFAGWSPALADVTGDQTYTATYNSSVNSYTITFVDGSGNTLQSSAVAYGETPAYAGEAPTKAATAQYTYSFTGWSPTIGTVTGEQTYTAQFSETVNKYTITWQNYNGTTLETDTEVSYSTMPSYDGATPAKDPDASYTYEFAGWDPAVHSVEGAQTYTATFTPVERMAFKAALTSPNRNSTVVAGKTGTITALVTNGVGTATTVSTGFTYSDGVATGTFTTNEWNAPVDWVLTATRSDETATLPGRFYTKAETEWFNKANDALDEVDGFGSAVTTGVNMTNSPSAAGQQVRINTRLEVSVAESVPETGDSRGGFAVLKLAGDSDAAYYAFNGTDWVKLLGATPVASSEVDFFAVADMADKTVSYYVNGVALYTTNSVGAPVYAIGLGGDGDSLEALGFSNAAGVKAAVVGEYDVPYVAAIGDDGYTTAAAFVTELVATNKAIANNVTVELLAHDIGGSISLAYGEKVTVVNAGGYTNGPAFAVTDDTQYRIIETVDGNATIYTVSNTPVVIWHVGDTVVTADGTMGQVPVFDGRPTKARPDGRPGTYYKFRGWATSVDGTPGDPSAISSMETEYYAIFELVEATFFLID